MKYILALIISISIFSCNNKSSSNTFDSDKLTGKFEVDLTPFISEKTKSDKDDDGWTSFGKGIAALALSTVDVEISFYDNNKGVMHMDGGLIDFISARFFEINRGLAPSASNDSLTSSSSTFETITSLFILYLSKICFLTPLLDAKIIFIYSS